VVEEAFAEATEVDMDMCVFDDECDLEATMAAWDSTLDVEEAQVSALEARFLSASHHADGRCVRLEHKKRFKQPKVNLERAVSVRAVKREAVRAVRVELDQTAPLYASTVTLAAELSERLQERAPLASASPLSPVPTVALRRRRHRDNAPMPSVSHGAYYGDRPDKPRKVKAPSKSRAQPSPAEVRESERRYEADLRRAMAASSTAKHESGLTLQQLLELSQRDLTPEDYEMLLLLDSTVAKKTVAAAAVDRLPARVLAASDALVSPAVSACSVCMGDYAVGERVSELPCHHAFHSDCLAPWLKERSQHCPLCNHHVA